MKLICCEQRGVPCIIHHGEDTNVISAIGHEIIKNGVITYGEIINKCYDNICATRNEVKWTVDKLISSNVLTETYDSINLPQEEKKYIWLFIEVPDRNRGRI